MKYGGHRLQNERTGKVAANAQTKVERKSESEREGNAQPLCSRTFAASSTTRTFQTCVLRPSLSEGEINGQAGVLLEGLLQADTSKGSLSR